MKKIGLYIHIPFCKQKCHYCDFYSITNADDNCKKQYMKALIKEIELNSNILEDKKIDTIFIGGGTPSTVDVGYYHDIINYLNKKFIIDDNPEISIEVNPKRIGQKYLKRLKEIGVNRLSIGIQTFDENILKIIGRNHSRNEAINFLEKVNEVGFDNLSCDLIFNLPLQKFIQVKEDITLLESYNTKHISFYSLKVNPKTKINNIIKDEKYKLMNDEDERDLYYKGREFLKDLGYYQYEISNFSKKGYESKHNLKYWNREEYLGIGAAAHSFIGNKRYSNILNVEKYIHLIREDNQPIDMDNLEILTKEEERWEFLFLGLRKTQGIKISEFEKKFDISFDEYNSKITKLQDYKLLEKSLDRIKLTQKGMDLANYVFIELK